MISKNSINGFEAEAKEASKNLKSFSDDSKVALFVHVLYNNTN